MKPHRVGPVAFLVPFVPLIFCSSLSAQTDQPFSVEVSGLALGTQKSSAKFWEWGVEGQIRWTRSAWSFGAGVQYMSSFRSSGQGSSSGDSASTLGLFLEPRFVFMAFGDRFGLYFLSGVAVSRISESGTRTSSTVFDMFGNPVGGGNEISFEVTRTSLTAYGGLGLLIRLTSRVNLDLGGIGGFNRWGEPDPIPPDNLISNEGYGSFLGGRVGLVIGIG